MRRVAILAVAVLALSCGKTSQDVPFLAWHSLAEGEAVAHRDQKPALLFFEAQWSTADKELEHVTFPDPEVRTALRDWVVIRVDMTDDEDPATTRAANAFKILGVPTIRAYDYGRPFAEQPPLLDFNEFLPPPKLAASIRATSQVLRDSHHRAVPR